MWKIKAKAITKKVLMVLAIFVVSMVISRLMLVKQIKVVDVNETNGKGYVHLQIGSEIQIYEYKTKEAK